MSVQVAVDPKKFLGLSSVADAVEYLHSGQSIGKVFAPLYLVISFLDQELIKE